jgi:hypothetical protein
MTVCSRSRRSVQDAQTYKKNDERERERLNQTIGEHTFYYPLDGSWLNVLPLFIVFNLGWLDWAQDQCGGRICHGWVI